ncbi:MAG: AAA family ATPase [Prevotellaceae bacterium]|nr:AAA family ATPase [Candidatus Colivivens equi]
MIKSIGFKNFRNFKHFPLMPLDDVTILVGKNNAGKSTITKALRLILNKDGGLLSFLDNPNSNFNFNVHEVNIGSFDRALCNQASDDFIQFFFEISDYYVEFDVVKVKNGHGARISRIKVVNGRRYFGFEINILYESIQGKFIIDPDGDLNCQKKDIKEIAQRIKRSESLSDLSLSESSGNSTIEIHTVLNTGGNLFPTLDWKHIWSFLFSFDEKSDMDSSSEPHGDFDYLPKATHSDFDRFPEAMQTDYADAIRIFSKLAWEFMDNLKEELQGLPIYFKGAHAATQSIALKQEDRNDYAAMIVSDFYNSESRILPRQDGNRSSKLPENSPCEPSSLGRKFVEKWMKEFEVGEKFEITDAAGEIFWLKIFTKKDDTPENYTYLADKGVGAIQVMLLLLKIGAILNKLYPTDKVVVEEHEAGIHLRHLKGRRLIDTKYFGRYYHALLIVEEPEQNLHPCFQSKLFDLFTELVQLGIQIIVETHSEYMVQRSQVVAGDIVQGEPDGSTDDIPFSVFYIDNDLNKPCRRIPYDERGVFTEDFGEGFFDESSKHAIAIITRKKR